MIVPIAQGQGLGAHRTSQQSLATKDRSIPIVSATRRLLISITSSCGIAMARPSPATATARYRGQIRGGWDATCV